MLQPKIFNFLLSTLLSYIFIYIIPWHDFHYFHDFEVYKLRVMELFMDTNLQNESFGIFLLYALTLILILTPDHNL